MNAGNSTSRSSRALAVASAATFLSFLDATVTNLAVPSVAAEFDVDVATVAWVATAYVVPLAAFLALAGAVADAVGRTRLFQVGAATFTLFSILIAAAPTFGVLLAGRAVQGLGAALMIPASLALLLAEVPVERRRAAIGMWSAAGALAAAAGPAVGGVVVDAADWRVLFCINIPIGAWVVWSARPLLTDDTRTGRLPDLTGGLLLALAIGAVVYGLTEAPDRGWTSGIALAAFSVAVVTAVFAVLRAPRHARPALRLDLLRGRSLATATAISTTYGAALFSTMMLGVLFLVDVWEYSPLEAGLAMTPAALVTAAVGIGAGRLLTGVPPRRLIAVGGAFQAASTALLAVAISGTPHFVTVWLPLGTLMGVGVGLVTVGVSTAGAMAAPPQDFATATGLIMAARQLGGALGIAVLAAVLAAVAATTPERPYAAVYWFATAAAVASALLAGLLRPAGVPSPAAQRTRVEAGS